MNLNEEQKKAVNHGKGPMLVLAGPGSGKTTVITQRVRYLIESGQAPANNILVITFTKAAAEEMRTRFQEEGTATAKLVRFGTFHAIFFMILKHAYRYSSGNILKEGQKKQFLHEIMTHLKLEAEDETEYLSSVASEISLVKSERISLEHYFPVNCSGEVFQQFFAQYQECLRQNGLLDFDDMLVYCYELLSARDDILKIWQNQFQYILIDEFQDINKIQYDIIKMLAKPENNLFVVGDDDQSIYRFRGAKPEIMLKFEQDYPGSGRVLLDINYRSTKAIVDAASCVIRNNLTRFTKGIRTINQQGERIEIKRFSGLVEENGTVVERLLAYRRTGMSFSKMAVLFRTNTQPRALVGKLMEYNIPFHMKDVMPNLYDHWIAGDIKTYMILAAGNMERGRFLRIMNRPKRYISRDYIDDAQVDFEQLRISYEEKPWMLDRLDRMEYDLKMLAGMAPFAAINYIRKAIGYDEFLKEYSQMRNMDDSGLFELLDEIQELSRAFQTSEEWFEHMEQYGQELIRQRRNMRESGQDALAMVTLHGSKGLEYEAVFIIDANEGIMPHKKAVLDVDLEEERRMFYVAMTRAKERLHIFYVDERYNKKMEPSRFLSEIGNK